MKTTTSFLRLLPAAGLALLAVGCARQEPQTSRSIEKILAVYEQHGMELPEDVLAPGAVETGIGVMRYDDGRPTEATVELAYGYIDRARAVQAFLNNLSAVATEALRIAFREMGATESNHVLISEQLIDARQVWPTGNTGTVYVFGYLDLQKDGPTVIEMPGGAGPGFMDDGWMRWVCDMGPTGPDRGKGGTYVFLPPDYEGDMEAPLGAKKVRMKIGGVMKDVFAVKSPTYHNWMALRGFLVDGKPDASVALFKEKLRIYPLSKAADPPPMKFINMSDKKTVAIFPAGERYFSMLNDVIQREPLDAIDPESRGLLASIGIEKGEPFDPDGRWKPVYEDAARIGDAVGRSILYAPRDPAAYIYPDRRWYYGFVGGSHLWLKDGGRGGIDLDARTLFFYGAIAITPAMAAKMVGLGSQYAFCSRDKDGAYFDGSKTYRLRMPPNVPAKDFWSIVLYDPQTRAMLPTGQRYPAVNSRRSNLQTNGDGSVDLYFGPEPPAGKESNWVQTVPGKGWFVLLRLYGPLEPWFDKTWKPNDFELVE